MTLLITVTLKSGTLLLLPIELILPVLGILLIRTESPIRGLIYRSFLGSIAALIYASVGAKKETKVLQSKVQRQRSLQIKQGSFTLVADFIESKFGNASNFRVSFLFFR